MRSVQFKMPAVVGILVRGICGLVLMAALQTAVSTTPVRAAPGETQEAWGYTEADFRKYSERYENGELVSTPEIARLAELTFAWDTARGAAQLLEKEIRAGRVARAADAWHLLSELWLGARDWERARSALLSIEQSPLPFGLEFNVGRTFFQQGIWERAEYHFRRALGQAPKSCRTRLMLGHTLDRRGSSPAALKEYRRAGRSRQCKALGRAWAAYAKGAGQQRRTPVAAPDPEGPSTASSEAQADPVDDALNTCQNGVLEHAQDQFADMNAQIALINAHPDRKPFPPGEMGIKLKRMGFEQAYLMALGHLRAGAVDRAKADLARTTRTRKQVSATEAPQKVFLQLLIACEDLHRDRLKKLERTKKLSASARANIEGGVQEAQ